MSTPAVEDQLLNLMLYFYECGTFDEQNLRIRRLYVPMFFICVVMRLVANVKSEHDVQTNRYFYPKTTKV